MPDYFRKTLGKTFEHIVFSGCLIGSVREKVVNYNPNIMSKNWIQLQDNTGSATRNNKDLVVTTSEQLDTRKTVITIEDAAISDRDSASGYRHVVIIEDTSILN